MEKRDKWINGKTQKLPEDIYPVSSFFFLPISPFIHFPIYPSSAEAISAPTPAAASARH
jgi:hypothetical protein